MRSFLLATIVFCTPPLFAQAPVITSGSPIAQQGQTFQFTATGAGITWSVTGSDGGSINSSSGLYTAPGSVTANHSFGGCQLFSNEHIYNTDISGQSVDSNSATWVTALGSIGGLHLGTPEIQNNFSTAGTTAVQNLTVSFGHGGNYTILQPPYRREQNGYFIYTKNDGTSFSNQDHHFWMTYPSTCSFAEFYQMQGPGAATADSADSVNYSDFVFPSNAGINASGVWMFALSIKAAELEAAVASSATMLHHAIRTTLGNGIICGSSTANACGENAGGTRHIWPATSEAFAGGGTIPYGACIRLKASINISSYTAVEQIVLNTMKHYCIFVTDGTTSSDSFNASVEAGPYSLSDLTSANFPASSFEFVNIQGLEVSSTSGAIATNGPDKVCATNGSGSTCQYVMVVGPTIAVPYDDISYPHLSIQAGQAAQQLTAFVNGIGTASSAVIWSMSPSSATYGTITSGGLYTPPATVSGNVALTTVVTATMAAGPTAQIYLNIVPQGPMRFILNGQCGAATSFTHINSGVCTSTAFTDSNGLLWEGTMPGWSISPSCTNNITDQLFGYPGSENTNGDVRFDIYVPSGKYLVSQNFEVGGCAYNNTPGAQFETLETQGVATVTNLDIAAVAGSGNPLTENYIATVNNGLLSVVLRSTGVGAVGPTISSMQITPLGTTITSNSKLASGTQIQ